jgi:hypothetical protein
VLDLLEYFGDLVYRFPICPFPASPLLSVNRTQVSVLIGPFVPNRYVVLLKVFDIGVSLQKPKQFIDHAFHMNLLGGYQWKTLLKVKPQLGPEATTRARTCTIGLYRSFVQDMLQ